ncbi:hypothetical protein F5Y19DRAFT_221444 [Xylariaceae sp. FL1651]|nr:hypothetical protein F5Y19DRAFT_221444 [Xylariaceae sp. FL1651]
MKVVGPDGRPVFDENGEVTFQYPVGLRSRLSAVAFRLLCAVEAAEKAHRSAFSSSGAKKSRKVKSVMLFVQRHANAFCVIDGRVPGLASRPPSAFAGVLPASRLRRCMYASSLHQLYTDVYPSRKRITTGGFRAWSRVSSLVTSVSLRGKPRRWRFTRTVTQPYVPSWAWPRAVSIWRRSLTSLVMSRWRNGGALVVVWWCGRLSVFVFFFFFFFSILRLRALVALRELLSFACLRAYVFLCPFGLSF